MKIGVLGAMLEEVSSIKSLMEHPREIEIGSRNYIEGNVGGIEVVLTFSRWGKVASACSTTTLINRFDVDYVIFTGVAGAVDNELNIGDVVIGNGLYQHDMDARPIFDQFQIPLTQNIVFKPRAEDISFASQAAQQFILEFKKHLTPELLSKYSISSPKVCHGLIASGDKFVSDPAHHDNLQFSHEGLETLAVEMEGAAVAQICTEYQIPYVIIRTISDKADHSAAIDFQSFVNEVASQYSVGIISRLLKNLSNNSAIKNELAVEEV